VSIPTPDGALAGPETAPDLSFAVESSAADLYAAVPTLRFRVRVERVGGGPIRSIALNAQLRIAATRRAYDERARGSLVELFGRADQWARGLRSLPWANVTVNVPPFEDSTVAELPVTCTYDFEVASAKYFHALDEGEIPLEVLFSGTIFYPGDDGGLRIAHVPWEKEAEHRMPVRVWKEMMDRYFPESAWLRLRQDSFDRLYTYKVRSGLLTWEEAVDALLAQDGARRGEADA
jgi:hypothetical protein